MLAGYQQIQQKNFNNMEQKVKILGRIDLKTGEVYNKEGKLLKGKEQTAFILRLQYGDPASW